MSPPESVTIEVGGEALRFTTTVDMQIPLVDRHVYADFISSREPHAEFTVQDGPAERFPTERPFFESHAWALHDSIQGPVLSLYRRGKPAHRLIVFNEGFKGGNIYCYETPSQSGRTFPVLLSPALEVLFHILFTENQWGALLHASAVVEDGEAILFSGISGAGKSTMLRLWQKHTNAHLLNDDRIILRKQDNGFRAYGTPWHGSLPVASSRSAPLHKIFVIQHAPRNYVRELSVSEAAKALLARSFPPIWGAKQLSFTLAFLEDVAHQVPCYELGYVPTSDIIEFVRCVR